MRFIENANLCALSYRFDMSSFSSLAVEVDAICIGYFL